MSTPEVSVVIPTLRRAEQLRRVLRALSSQETPPANFEVVVASDAKEEDPSGVAATLGRCPYPARNVKATVPGASAARNTGWRAAAAELIVFLDDDILPGPTLLAQHLDWHRQNPGLEVAVLGHVSWASELRITPFMRWLDQGFQFGFGSIHGTEARWTHLYTANVSIKRELLERVGGFDEAAFPFGYEDLDLAKRMQPHGLRLLYNRAAEAEHLHPATVAEWKGTVARIAGAERVFVRRYPDVEPYFYKVLARPSETPRLWRRTAPLARVVPRRVPWLGPRVWAAAKASYRRALAPSFFRAWEEAGEPDAGK